MTSKNASDTDVAAWFSGRLPKDWAAEAPEIAVDREEITVWVHVPEVDLGDDATDEAKAEAAAGRISGWRESWGCRWVPSKASCPLSTCRAACSSASSGASK